MFAFRRLYTPDAEPTPRTSSTPAIPPADLDLLATAEAVATKWATTPAITLLWKTQSTFSRNVADYRTALTGRISAGSQRPGQTQALAGLDIEVDNAVKEVKNYIEEKYRTAAAPAYFPRYGIVKENGTYQLPRDRNERLEAFAQMLAGLAADGLGEKEFGSAYWTALRSRYDAALKASNATDSSVSTGVATKNGLKAEVKKVLRALRYVLRGHFPDTYAAEYRAWGLQKEDY